MSQQVVCDQHKGAYRIVKQLKNPIGCKYCGKPALLIIDTLSKDVETENVVAFNAAITAQKAGEVKRHLPSSWIIVDYQIPETHRNLRNRIFDVCISGGLSGRGSYYCGPSNTALDQEIVDTISKVKAQLGEGDWIDYIQPTCNDHDAEVLRDKAVGGAFDEMKRVEENIEQLERILAGDEKVYGKNDKGETIERKVESFGPARIRDAKSSLEYMDSVLQRFQGNAEMENAADGIKLRVKEISAYVEKVDKSLNNYVARISVKKSMGAA